MPGDSNPRFGIIEDMRRMERVEILAVIGVRRFHWPALLTSVVALGGCGGPLSALDPAGPSARETLTLLQILLAMAAGSFLIIFGLFLLAFRRNRRRTAAPGLFLVWGGLVFPITLLTTATVYGVVLGERIIGARQKADVIVEVEAESWLWRFTRHAATGSRTSINTLDIPAGRPVELVVTSKDIIHSFWAPRLGGKIDAIPGVVNRFVIRADRPGSYSGVCAEFCGVGHTIMALTVVAHDSESWAAIESGGEP